MKPAILFDLDGTMWDSTGFSTEIWMRVMARHSEIPFEMSQSISQIMMGMTIPEMEAYLFPSLTHEERHAVMEEYCVEETAFFREHGAVLYDGLEETLAELQKTYRLFIVSNCQDGYIEAFLHAHKLGRYFEDIESAGRTGLGKGENIRLVMARNNVTRAVYVGDTAGDEKAARFAGIPFIFAEYGFGQAVCPDARIASIRETAEKAALLI